VLVSLFASNQCSKTKMGSVHLETEHFDYVGLTNYYVSAVLVPQNNW